MFADRKSSYKLPPTTIRDKLVSQEARRAKVITFHPHRFIYPDLFARHWKNRNASVPVRFSKDILNSAFFYALATRAEDRLFKAT